MKKKVTVLSACILAAAGVVVGASAMGMIQRVESEIRSDFTVKLDGQTQSFKNVNGEPVYPMLYNGTTYLPVRSIGEIMGKTVYWYEDSKTIELKSEQPTVTDADVIVTAPQADPVQGGGVNLPLEGGAPANPAALPDNFSGAHHRDEHHGGASSGYAADNPGSAREITLERAKEIALQKAGFTADQVRFTEAKRDFDNGRYVYEIEFVKDRVEYSAEILASDGTVVSWEID